MQISSITVQDFKNLFARDFPFLPVWDNTQLYNTGAIVYYVPTLLFYKAKVNGIAPGTLPTDATKWDLYPEGSTDNYVSDADIERAFLEAEMQFNQALFSEDRFIKVAFLYLAANYLVNDIRATRGGISGSPSFSVASRSVGNVSESYNIPASYTDNPAFAFLTQTAYGMKYLQMILPAMVGNVGVVCGATTP